MTATNFLEETLEALREYDKTPTDIHWIGTLNGNAVMSWPMFKEHADFEYNDDFRGVNSQLVIVGGDWWMERDYDDNLGDSWAFRTMPKMDGKVVGIFNLKG